MPLTEQDLLEMLREKSEIAYQQARKRKIRVTTYDYAIGIILLSLAGMVVAMIYEVMR